MTVTTLDPRTALVVIDLQGGVVANPAVAPHSAADVVARTASLAAAFRSHGLPVVLVRVSFRPDGSDAAPGRIEGGPRPRPAPKAGTLAVDAMTDLHADAHRHSLERIFPRLGETGTTKEILALI